MQRIITIGAWRHAYIVCGVGGNTNQSDRMTATQSSMNTGAGNWSYLISYWRCFVLYEGKGRG